MPERAAFPWKWLLIGLGFLSGLVALAACWWLMSQRDLDAAESRARAAGAILPPEPGNPAGESAGKALVARIARIGPVPELSPAQPPPAAAEAVAALLDARFDVALEDIDQVAGGMVAGGMVVDAYGAEPALRLLAARIVFGPRERVLLQVTRLHRLNGACRSAYPTWSERIPGARLLAWAVGWRWSSGDLPHEAEIIAILSASAALLEEEGRSAGMRMHAAILAVARKADPDMIRWMGVKLPGIYDSAVGSRVLERFARGPLLDDLLRYHLAARDSVDLRGLLAAGGSDTWRRSASSWDLLPNRFLTRCVMLGSFVSAQATAVLRLRAQAAVMGGTPLPEDPYAPAGTRMRLVERDGRVIGTYSVGIDGIDGGGSRKSDLCIPLGAVLGSPSMGDPPRPH